MFDYLQIYDPRERWLVGAADAMLGVVRLGLSPVPRRRLPDHPRRILLLRLERIGDLLMTIDAIDAVRREAPEAEIDLVVGSWNEPIARQLRGIDRVETLDVAWLSRGGKAVSRGDLIRVAAMWRERRYDLAINFEGDIRSNMLLGLTRAPRRVGFGMAGGRAALTDVVSFESRMHVADNALRLVRAAFGPAEDDVERARPLDAVSRTFPRFQVPDQAQVRAADLLAPLTAPGRPAPVIGLHPGGGRQIKQWDVGRMGEVGLRLARERGARLVVTGAAEDGPLVGRLIGEWPADVVVADLSGAVNLLELAAVLQRLDLFITPDTGPMHLAAAMGTPVLGIFGPSDPGRYAPIGPATRVVRIDLPCSPCNRIRLPPERCQGHVPDCLKGIDAHRVFDAAISLLEQSPARTHATHQPIGVGHRSRD